MSQNWLLWKTVQADYHSSGPAFISVLAFLIVRFINRLKIGFDTMHFFSYAHTRRVWLSVKDLDKRKE